MSIYTSKSQIIKQWAKAQENQIIVFDYNLDGSINIESEYKVLSSVLVEDLRERSERDL